jgi:hypothetical protein
MIVPSSNYYANLILSRFFNNFNPNDEDIEDIRRLFATKSDVTLASIIDDERLLRRLKSKLIVNGLDVSDPIIKRIQHISEILHEKFLIVPSDNNFESLFVKTSENIPLFLAFNTFNENQHYVIHRNRLTGIETLAVENGTTTSLHSYTAILGYLRKEAPSDILTYFNNLGSNMIANSIELLNAVKQPGSSLEKLQIGLGVLQSLQVLLAETVEALRLLKFKPSYENTDTLIDEVSGPIQNHVNLLEFRIKELESEILKSTPVRVCENIIPTILSTEESTVMGHSIIDDYI